MLVTVSYTPQKLTLRAIKRRALAAYDARTLTAQARERGDRRCFYEYNGRHCAIGAALSRDALKCIDGLRLNSSSITVLIRRGVVVCSGNDLPAIVAIQSSYDWWVREARNNGGNSYYARKARQIFLKLIQS